MAMECLMRSIKQWRRRQVQADDCPLLRRMPEDRNGSLFPVYAEFVERRLLDPKAGIVNGSYQLSFLVEVSRCNASRLEVVSESLS